MVWDGVSQHHRTKLVFIVGNLNAVRVTGKTSSSPFLQAHPDMTLQHNNDTSHVANSVRDSLQDSNVSVLPWPAKSPDLNLIEHIWDLLDRGLRLGPFPP